MVTKKPGDLVILIGQPHQWMTIIQQTVFGDFPHWFKCGWITTDGLWQQVELPEAQLQLAGELLSKEGLQDALGKAWAEVQENKDNGSQK